MDAAARQVNALLAATGAHPWLDSHDGEPWHLHFHGAEDSMAVGWAAGCATGLAVVLGSELHGRIGVCTAPRCDRVYVDTSRNGTRRFCSTTCQNRVKAAAFRARQATSANPGAGRDGTHRREGEDDRELSVDQAAPNPSTARHRRRRRPARPRRTRAGRTRTRPTVCNALTRASTPPGSCCCSAAAAKAPARADSGARHRGPGGDGRQRAVQREQGAGHPVAERGHGSSGHGWRGRRPRASSAPSMDPPP